MDYYSPFWGPKQMSIVVEPQGALTCRSSTLTDLADSSPFRGLLLTILGPWSDFHDYEPWGAFTFRSSTLMVLADSDPFRGLLLTGFGPQSDFHSC